MFKSCIDKEGYFNYYNTFKLDSGQTIKIEFQEDETHKKYYYNIYLVISHKRKQESSNYMKITGKDGLRGLLWAKQNIIEFEQFISEIRKGYDIIIYCNWDDNRRRNVYEYGLKKLGYRFNIVLGNKALSKIFNL